MTESKDQIIKISDLRELINHDASIAFKRKRGQVGGWFLEIEVKIFPPVSEKEHNSIVSKIIAHYGEDLIEVYTEETGYWFYVYLRMSPTQPTTISL